MNATAKLILLFVMVGAIGLMIVMIGLDPNSGQPKNSLYVDGKVTILSEFENNHFRMLKPDDWTVVHEAGSPYLGSYVVRDAGMNDVFTVSVTSKDEPILCGCYPTTIRVLARDDGCKVVDFLSDSGRTHKTDGKKYLLDIHASYEKWDGSRKWNRFLIDTIIDSAMSK